MIKRFIRKSLFIMPQLKYLLINKHKILKKFKIIELDSGDGQIIDTLKVFDHKYRDVNFYGEHDLSLRGGSWFSKTCVKTVRYGPGQFHAFSRYLKVGGVRYFWEQVGVETQNNSHKNYIYTKIKKRDGVIVFANVGGTINNYFHFICDALPSLILSMRNVNKFNDKSRYQVLVPVGIPENCKKLIEDCCNKYGFAYEYIKPFDKYQFQNCVVTNYGTAMHYDFPFSQNFSVNTVAIRYLRYVLKNVYNLNIEAKNSEQARNIYLTRSTQKRLGGRHVLNSEELARALIELDFTVIDPAHLDTNEAVKLYANCTFMVLDGGAALANAIFMPKGSKVGILAMKSGTDTSLFRSYCQSLGVDCFYVTGDPDEDSHTESWHKNYYIDSLKLKEAISDVRNQ